MNKPVINLQDGFLNQVRKEGIAVTIFLINGFQVRGLVKGFDNFTIILDTDGKQEMIYKHAVSTIIPARALPDLALEKKEEL
ncbi:MAG TPA: RNA chaperone Hfq [Firmicutes bacterium]|jgi:host factor-I protein|nr:RNA chaperone Hfq [Bacillota bacterium]